jgi:hypothetical protein
MAVQMGYTVPEHRYHYLLVSELLLSGQLNLRYAMLNTTALLMYYVLLSHLWLKNWCGQFLKGRGETTFSHCG